MFKNHQPQCTWKYHLYIGQLIGYLVQTSTNIWIMISDLVKLWKKYDWKTEITVSEAN